jgi:rhodanese-related sulfurtransferase
MNFVSQGFDLIDVQAFAQRLAQSDVPLQVVDVREPQEVAIASLPGCIHLPLSQSADWAERILSLLDPEQETIVLCHHGLRSAHMCQWLAQQGFRELKNLVGGIDAYAVQIDPTMARY